MASPTTARVASHADRDYLPASWYEADYDQYEFVWWLDNETNLPIKGDVVDTIKSVYAKIDIIILDPTDQSTWSMVAEDVWSPCDTDDTDETE